MEKNVLTTNMRAITRAFCTGGRDDDSSFVAEIKSKLGIQSSLDREPIPLIDICEKVGLAQAVHILDCKDASNAIDFDEEIRL
jgi:hypothetical protein